jgi:hypothetical protein
MQMSDATRSGARGSGRSGNDRNGQQPPLSPLLNQSQFFSQFLGEMHSLSQNIAQQQERCPGNASNQYNTFKDFLETGPRSFREAVEPFEADDWITNMEKKFRLLRLTEELKTKYAVQLLEGPAVIWWTQHRATYSANTPILWAQFTTAFRENYNPLNMAEDDNGDHEE